MNCKSVNYSSSHSILTSVLVIRLQCTNLILGHNFNLISQHFQIFDLIPLTKCLFPHFTERPMPKTKETPQNSPLSLLTMSLVSLVWLPESSLPPSINQVGRRLNCLLNVYQHRPHRVGGWLKSSQPNDSVFELREVNVAGMLVKSDLQYGSIHYRTVYVLLMS